MKAFTAFRSAALAFLGATALIGCASAQTPAPAPTPVAPTTQAAPAAPVSLQAPSPDEYRLGSGDEIKVTVFGEPTLSGPFVVDGLGFISMSAIGEVAVKDKTLRDVQRAIEEKLKVFIKAPQVSAEMTKGRPFYILGEINKAGEYPFTPGLTVMKAIAAAGDFTYRANKKQILIKHANGDREEQVDLTALTPVLPGDTIRIKERLF